LPLHVWFLSADAAGSLLQLGATVLTVPTIVYFAPHSSHTQTIIARITWVKPRVLAAPGGHCAF